jgi:hypothetical protein
MRREIMRSRLKIAVLAIVFTVTTASARAADEWGLENESVETFKAKVVDVACELTGQCVDNCGDGKRQLGLLKADGTLRIAAKGSTDFAGSVRDILPYCGKEIFVDGLLIKSPKMTMYFVQYLREKESDPWIKTDGFMSDWEARNGKAEQWFRADPEVRAIIAEQGVFGLGPDVKPKPQ